MKTLNKTIYFRKCRINAHHTGFIDWKCPICEEGIVITWDSIKRLIKRII